MQNKVSGDIMVDLLQGTRKRSGNYSDPHDTVLRGVPRHPASHDAYCHRWHYCDSDDTSVRCQIWRQDVYSYECEHLW